MAHTEHTTPGKPDGPAAAGFCVIHQLQSSAMRFGGYSGSVVVTVEDSDVFIGAFKATNGTAEVQASVMASLCMLQSEVSRFTLCFDAQYAENVASAMAKPKTNIVLANVASALRQLLHADMKEIDSYHVKSHSGEPWNELADVIADQVSRRGMGFAVNPFPEGIKAIIAGKCGDMQWLHLHASGFMRHMEYPPMNSSGQFQPWKCYSNGALALPDENIAAEIDRVEVQAMLHRNLQMVGS